MDQDEKGTKTLGDEVMEQVGKLKELTKELKEAGDYKGVEPKEVGEWITAIGKALLSIFK